MCDKPGVINLSSHLGFVHDITGPKRSELLKEARVFWELKPKPGSSSAENLFRPSEKRSSEPRKRTMSVKETRQPTPAAKRPKFTADVSLATTTQDNCRLRTNILPSEERFDNVGVPDNILQDFGFIN